MVFKLSLDEVLKVCGNCEKYDKGKQECRPGDDVSSSAPLKTVKKCKKWDDFFGGPCLYLGQ